MSNLCIQQKNMQFYLNVA
uniref:Uncharacterized protein n=1 Tax=Arundo donax TaxID=35708 RepID=A0A0A9AQG6_ARUDO